MESQHHKEATVAQEAAIELPDRHPPLRQALQLGARHSAGIVEHSGAIHNADGPGLGNMFIFFCYRIMMNYDEVCKHYVQKITQTSKYK